MSDGQAGSSGLFAIFSIAIYSLVLIPYTISSFCSSSEDEEVTPWQQVANARICADMEHYHHLNTVFL
jgi:hypothetical protein